MKRELTVTVVVEHADGPYSDDLWEQDVPYAVERAVEEGVLESVGVHGATFRIASAKVEDVAEVTS